VHPKHPKTQGVQSRWENNEAGVGVWFSKLGGVRVGARKPGVPGLPDAQQNPSKVNYPQGARLLQTLEQNRWEICVE